MDFSNDFLGKCSELKLVGYAPELKIGMIVARGFADLGFETFGILPNNKMVSLFTGEVSSLPVEHEHHFFHVPDVDALIQELARRGFVVEAFQSPDGRSWRATVRETEGGSVQEFEGETLLASLMNAMISKATSAGT